MGKHDYYWSYADKDVPPQIPIISGVTPKRKIKDDNKSDLQETVINTTAAVLKAMNGGLLSSSAVVQSPASQGKPTSGIIVGRSGNLPVGISPSKVTEIGGKSFEKLSSLKRLSDESVLTSDKFEEQKSAILGGLKILT